MTEFGFGLWIEGDTDLPEETVHMLAIESVKLALPESLVQNGSIELFTDASGQGVDN